MSARDSVADAYEAAEKRLNEWGRVCRQNSEALGLPRISGIRQMIEHVRREDRLRKGVRKKSVRDVRRAWKKNEDTDAKETSEAFKYTEPDSTAKGKQPAVFKRPTLLLDSKVLEVDAIVAGLPGWMQATIIRSYLYSQPDENACRDLRMRKSKYKDRREAAVEYVVDRLAERLASVGKP